MESREKQVVMTKTLVVIVGPTGVGKSDFAVWTAGRLGAPVLSCDSRQMYRNMRIGTAYPTDDQLSAVRHYFVGIRDVSEPYTAGRFEVEALALLEELFAKHDYVVVAGGSGMYADALCEGIDAVPGTNETLRGRLAERLEREGIGSLLEQLKTLDPAYYDAVDRSNPLRVLRALEVCLGTGRPYSELRTGAAKQRGFRIVKVVLDMDRDKLYDRIDRRVDAMMAAGLEAEARTLYPLRHLNALKTVGYSELFDCFDGKITLENAVELIKRNSRRYAKRQLTWFRRYGNALWLRPGNGACYGEQDIEPVIESLAGT